MTRAVTSWGCWATRLRAAIVPLVLVIASSPSSTAQPVTAVQVQGTWEITHSGPLVCATCDEFPLTLGLGAPVRVPHGTPTEITVSFSSLVSSVITLRKPVSLRVRIEGVPDSGCCPVVWEGILPPLTGSIPSGSVALRFLWDQHDGSGHPVPRGKYGVGVEFPITIAYTMGGTLGEERLTATSGHLLGGEISFGTIEVLGANQFYSPRGIFVDRAGRIYVADSSNNRIVRLDNMTGAGLLTLGDRQGAGVNQFYQPTGIFVDGAGRIYVADTLNDRIVRVNDMTGADWTTLGTSGSGARQFNRPVGIFEDGAGRIYVADLYNNRIVRMDDMTGAGWTTLGSKGPDVGQLSFPTGVFVGRTGRIYVADFIHIAQMDDMTGAGWTSLGGSQGSGVNQFSFLGGIFVDGAGRIYVTDNPNDRIVRVDDMTGAGWTTLGIQEAAANQIGDFFNRPSGIFVDAAGRIYVADTANDRIVRVNNMTGADWITFGAEPK